MKLDFTRLPDMAQLAAAERDRSAVRFRLTYSAGIRHRFEAWVVGAAGLLALAACAPYITAANGDRMRANSPAFRDYARQVFEMQNDAATTIAYVLDDLEANPEQSDRYNSIIAADDQMMDACSELNNAAVACRDDKQVSLRKLARVAGTIPDCERAAIQAVRLLAVATPDANSIRP